MNEQVRSILAQETTKTSKIRQLYLLGVPRAEIARMVTNGNYGFVVNALRRMREREDGLSIHPVTTMLDYTFNRKFGIEIEAYNCSRERLARELREADPVCKGVFRSTLFPPDPRQEKGSGLPELVEEICPAIGLEESDTDR